LGHHNTVYSQILKMVSRHEFSGAAKKHDGHRRKDAMSRWTQFIARDLWGQTRLISRNIWRQSKNHSKFLYHLITTTIQHPSSLIST